MNNEETGASTPQSTESPLSRQSVEKIHGVIYAGESFLCSSGCNDYISMLMLIRRRNLPMRIDRTREKNHAIPVIVLNLGVEICFLNQIPS